MCSVSLGGDMLVSRLVVPGGMVSWTVVGDDGLPVEPIECYLAHLARLERSPETVRGYAIGLKFFFGYLADRGLDGARPTWKTSPALSVGCALRAKRRCPRGRPCQALGAHGQPLPGCCVRLLWVPCPLRGRRRRRAGGLASGQPERLQAFLAPGRQGPLGPDPAGKAGRHPSPAR